MIRLCVFDAYGTLFDVTAAARETAREQEGETLALHWRQIAADWRQKQLQYTWIRAVSGTHADFWQVTQDSLDWALEAAGLTAAPGLRERLLELYLELAAYPEVPEMLSRLKGAGLATAILSNGSPGMLEAAVRSAGIGGELDAVLSVERVGVFKPHASVYRMVPEHFGCAPDETLFVSSNGWDAAAAAGFGFRAVWVNRAGEPVDRLPWRPERILTDLGAIPQVAGEL